MNVLLLHRDLPYHGGMARVFLELAREHDPSTAKLRVASFQAPSAPMEAALGECGVEVDTIGDSGVRPVARLRRLISSHGIDLVMAASLKAYLAAKAAVAGTRCRVVFAIHSIPLVIDGRFKRRLFRSLASHEPLIFPSQAVATEHLWPGYRGKYYVIHNGVRAPSQEDGTAPCESEEREAFGLPRDALVLGYTAEFIGWKDHDSLLAAFELLAAERADLRLVLMGTGERWRELSDAVNRHPAAERIHLLGPRTDARRLLGLLDVYVHPADGEGFGLAVAEAMLAALPVVAARSGALPELLEHERTGLLVPPRDAVSLANEIDRVISDSTLRARLAACAREDALGRFSPRVFAHSYRRAWQEAVSP